MVKRKKVAERSERNLRNHEGCHANDRSAKDHARGLCPIGSGSCICELTDGDSLRKLQQCNLVDAVSIRAYNCKELVLWATMKFKKK